METHLRLISLDVGEKRIGVALSDPTGTLATPLKTINSRGKSSDVAEVLSLVAEYGVAEIIVGLPLELSGRVGTQARIVERFVRSLSKASPVPVTKIDERYSSVQAERMLRESGKQPSKDKASVDAAAAAVVLQAYLDTRAA